MGMQNYNSTPGRHINLHIVKISFKNLQKQKEDQTVFYWKVKTSNIFTIMDLIATAGNDAFELRVSCNSLRSSSTPPNAAGSRLTSGFSERSSRRKRVPSNARAGTDPMRFAASVSSANWITVGLKFGTDVRPRLRQLMTYNTWGELCRLYRGWNDVTESMVTILSRHFVGTTGTMCAVNGRRFTILFN